MSTYNVVSGGDNVTVNKVTKSVYDALYPKVFKGNIACDYFNFKSLDYDIKSAPKFDLNPSLIMKDIVKKTLESTLQNKKLDIAVDEATKGTFSMEVDNFSGAVNYKDDSDPTEFNGSLVVSCEIGINSDHKSVYLEFSNGKVIIPTDPGLSDMLNKGVIPSLIDQLNDQVNHIDFPILSFLGVTLSLPNFVTQDNYLLTFMSISPNIVPPSPGNWPPKKAFVGMDATILDKMANNFLSSERLDGKWHYEYDIGLCKAKLDATYKLSFSNAKFILNPNPSSEITGSLDITANLNFSIKCGIFSATFGGTATAHTTMTGSVNFSGSKVKVVFKSLDEFTFHFEFVKYPWWIPKWFLELIADTLGPIIVSYVASSFRGYSFEVFTIPQINFKIEDINFIISLSNLAVSTIQDPDKKALATVAGDIKVSTK